MFDKFQLVDFYMAGPSQDLNIIHKNDLTYEFIKNCSFIQKINLVRLSNGDDVLDHCKLQNAEDGDSWFDWIVDNKDSPCGTEIENNGTHAIYKNAVQKKVYKIILEIIFK